MFFYTGDPRGVWGSRRAIYAIAIIAIELGIDSGEPGFWDQSWPSAIEAA